MDTLPITAFFIASLGLFAAWIAFLVHQEQQLRLAEGRPSAELMRADQGPIWVAAEPQDALAARHLVLTSSAPVALFPDAEPIEPELPVVRAGSFCRVPGAAAQNAHGDEMICSQGSSASARPRWRRALDLARSA
jgi:hypothetical protein